MSNQQDPNYDLARLCRLALEKQYGGQVPVPECLTKGDQSKKQSKLSTLGTQLQKAKTQVEKQNIGYKLSVWYCL